MTNLPSLRILWAAMTALMVEDEMRRRTEREEKRKSGLVFAVDIGLSIMEIVMVLLYTVQLLETLCEQQ